MPTAAHLLRLAQEAAPADSSAPADTELLRRYAATRDEAAFAELVRRNGPLVLRACRHILGETGADDAFQAVFLLLARSARRLSRPGSLAGWLHATAVRIANNARRGEGRRRKRESTRPAPTSAPDELTWREVREVLDAEIAELPELYRLPVVLCYLQELTHEEAARRAGCTVGALRGRLERGKERLRKKLVRYGLPLATPALVVGSPPPVSAALLARTIEVVRSASTNAVPPALNGLLSSTGRLRPVLLLAPAAAVVAAIGVVLAAGGPSADPPKAEPVRPATRSAAATRTDRFGDPLPDGVLMRLGTTRTRANIGGFGIAADGTVVTASTAAEVSIWPPRSDRPSETIRLTDPNVEGTRAIVAVSPDGHYIGVSCDQRLVVWERRGNAFKKKQTAVAGRYPFPRFSADSTKLAIGLSILDLDTGKCYELEEGINSSEGVAFSGDGKRLAATNGRELILLDLEKGETLAKYKTGRIHYSGIALDQAGDVIAVSPTWQPETVVFVEAKTGAPIAKLSGPEKFRCLWASFAPDGKTVLLGDRTGITWWDPAAGKVLQRFEGMAHSWSGGRNVLARFTADSKTLVGTSGRMLLRWDLATGKPLSPDFHDGGHHSDVSGIGVSLDGKWIATFGHDARIKVWDARTGQPVSTFQAGWVLKVPNLDFSPDGRFVYGPSPDDGTVSKWETSTGREVIRFNFSPDATKRGSLSAFRVNPDGRTVTAISGPFTASQPSLFGSWDTGSGKLLVEKPGPDFSASMFGLSFSPDGRWLANSSSLYPIDVGRSGNTLPKEGFSVFDPGTFSADGRLLVKEVFRRSEPAQRGVIVVLEVATGAKVAEFSYGTHGKFVFHSDGRSLAIAGPNKLIFHDVTAGKTFAERKAPKPDADVPTQSFARVVHYTPDGTRLITGHSDTTALVWDAPQRPKSAKNLGEKDRAGAWESLASTDGAKGWAAVWALADDPGAAAFLKDKLKPVELFPSDEFKKLLDSLNSEEFAERKAAAEKLKAAGERAVSQLRQALRGDPSAEQRDAINRLLDAVKAAERKIPAGDRLRSIRAIAALELTATADARELLRQLAGGAEDAHLTQEAKRAFARLRR